MRHLVLLSVSVLLTACGDDSANRTCSGFVGDEAAQPEIELLYLTPEGQAVECSDGARVPLIEAPQGGRHVFAGFRIRNVDTCPVRITGVVRNPETNLVRFEGRPVNFVDGQDGWAYAYEPSQISSYANIPLCPNIWSSKDIFEQPYELELTATDRNGRTVTKSAMITPYCGEPDKLTQCLSICREGYK